MYRYFSKEIIDAARANIDDIPIKLCVGGVQVYRKKIPHDKILEHCQKLMWDAFSSLYGIKDETPKGKTINEYMDSILESQSGFIGNTNRDYKAYTISKLKECMAIIKYIKNNA